MQEKYHYSNTTVMNNNTAATATYMLISSSSAQTAVQVATNIYPTQFELAYFQLIHE